MMGFIFGATPWLKSLLIGASAPLKVIPDSIKLLGCVLLALFLLNINSYLVGCLKILQVLQSRFWSRIKSSDESEYQYKKTANKCSDTMLKVRTPKTLISC